MKFLYFVDYTGDVETFEKGDLADYFVVGLLLDGEVVVGEMADGLETVGEGDFGTGE